MGNRDYLGTYNGSIFYPLDNEKLDDVNIESIAFALSTNSRFCGHTDKFWSVGQHSLLVCRIIEELCGEYIVSRGLNVAMAKLIALLHDASEAYLSDMCRPIKAYMSEYAIYESMVQFKIYQAFGISQTDIDTYKPFVSLADDTALYAEAIKLMNPSNKWLEDYSEGFSNEHISHYARYIDIENMQIVEAKFLKTCRELCSILGLGVNIFNNLPVIDIEPDECIVYSQGKIFCIFSEYDDVISIKTLDSNKEYKFEKQEINNTLDIRNFLNRRMKHAD